jgi:hypothetical protein
VGVGRDVEGANIPAGKASKLVAYISRRMESAPVYGPLLIKRDVPLKSAVFMRGTSGYHLYALCQPKVIGNVMRPLLRVTTFDEVQHKQMQQEITLMNGC